jgi:cysteine desulfurase
MNQTAVYLDHQASTPVDPRVLASMMPLLTDQYANPSSPHRLGQLAAAALRDARRQVQRSLGARRDTEIVFTSGATEANHLALIGVATAQPRTGSGHVVTTAIEHPSVLAACDQLTIAGFSVTKVGVGRDGRVDPDDIAAALTSDTVLVSVMYANNEIGTIQPITDIATITHRHGALLHVDAAQALSSISIDVNDLDIDLLTLSAHKINGPKGTGALYLRRGTPLHPQYAGSQEHGLRAGTVNLAGVIGLAEALRLLTTDREPDTHRITRLRDTLSDRLLADLPHAYLNGSRTHRLPGNLNITIPGIDAADLIDALPDLAISTGSACTSGAATPSHVLTAIGLTPTDARATLRISLGRTTRPSDIDYAAARIVDAVDRLLPGTRLVRT